MSLSLVILAASLTLGQNPTVNPETGLVRDVQPRIEPPVVTPRPSPDVQSPSTTAPPGMTPPRPTTSTTDSCCSSTGRRKSKSRRHEYTNKITRTSR